MLQVNNILEQEFPGTPLSKALEILDGELLTFQNNTSDLAGDYQKWHKWCAYSAIIAGFLTFLLAVLMVCWMVAYSENGEYFILLLRDSELFLAIIAVVSVILGYYRKNQQMFLLNRFFSERSRQLRYHSLTSENLWGCSTYDLWEEHIKKKIKELILSYSDEVEKAKKESIVRFPIKKIFLFFGFGQKPHSIIKDWIENEKVAPFPHDIPCSIPAESCREFIDYYLENRLDDQIKYYQNGYNQLKKMTRFLHKIPHATFFGSIAAVGIHFLLDFLGPQYHEISIFFIGVAVVLPFLGVSLRGITEVFQTMRIVTLYHAKSRALTQLREQFNDLSLHPEENWTDILKLMRQCENYFETEYREWLILVHEADWFI